MGNDKNRAALALSLAYALAMFHRTAFSEVASMLGSQGGLSAACLAWIGSAFFWVYLGFQIPAGILVDAVGSRKVSAWGSAAMAVGAACFASSSHPLALAAARGLCAAGAVSVFLALISYCGKSFGARSGAALGKSLLIGNLGGVASGAPLALALGLVGWRESWWILAAGSAAACVATLALVREGRASAPIFPALRRAAPAFVASLGHSDVYLAAGALAGLAGAFHAFSGFGAHELCAAVGIGGRVEGVIVSASVCGFAFGALLWGRVGDSPRARNTVARRVPPVALAIWSILAVAAPSSPWALGGLAFCAGIASAAFGNVYSMLDELCAESARGAVKATANCGIALGAALAQVGQGALPGALAALPCALLAIVGVACCSALAWRCRTGLTTMPSATQADIELGSTETA